MNRGSVHVAGSVSVRRFALSDGALHTVELKAGRQDFALRDDPLQGTG